MPPGELTAYYLRSIFEPSMQRDAYDLLTAKAKQTIPYEDFVFLRNEEASYILGNPSTRDTRVFVSIRDQYNFSNDHCVLFALLRIKHPYSLGERDTYRLVRLHCHRENEQWTVAPFMHAETATIIFVPTRMSGPLWRLSRDANLIATLIENEIAVYEAERRPPPEKIVPGESEEQPPLIIPDIPEMETPPETTEDAQELHRKVEAMLSLGKLCYEAGKINAAEETFRRAITLDPENAVARDYLSRCESYRLLQEEKEDAVRLMEELLRLESEGRSEK
jgi:tetratricopeptide (TPR) repeat protein